MDWEKNAGTRHEKTHRIIDEYQIMVDPVAIGDGTPIFGRVPVVNVGTVEIRPVLEIPGLPVG